MAIYGIVYQEILKYIFKWTKLSSLLKKIVSIITILLNKFYEPVLRWNKLHEPNIKVTI